MNQTFSKFPNVRVLNLWDPCLETAAWTKDHRINTGNIRSKSQLFLDNMVMIWCLVRAKMVKAVSLGSYGSTQHDWHRKYRKLKSKQQYNQLHTVWSECHFCVGFCTNRVFGSKAFTFARCLCVALHAFLWPVCQSVQSKCTSMCLPALCGANVQVCTCLPSVLFVECIMDVSSASDSQH